MSLIQDAISIFYPYLGDIKSLRNKLMLYFLFNFLSTRPQQKIEFHVNNVAKNKKLIGFLIILAFSQM